MQTKKQTFLDLGQNLALALVPFQKEDAITPTLKAGEDIPKGHKFALNAFQSGETLYKFGQPIGVITQYVEAGHWIHSHNLAFQKQDTLNHCAGISDQQINIQEQIFQGFHRPDGRVGTRNYIGVIATVNCSATVCRRIADQANKDILPKYANIDGFVPITHHSGCGISTDADSFKLLHRTISGYIAHPNFGAALVIGLGCEVNQISGYQAADSSRALMTLQHQGGSAKTVEKALEKLSEMTQLLAQNSKREAASTKHLCLGLQCGGSDGLSGITANPALGKAVDLLIQSGGSAILSETPEIFGAHHLLTARASQDVAYKIETCVQWWEDHAQKFNVHLDNNPSPGNKAGGLTTILEKSLGAVSKAGTTPVTGFYEYAQSIDTSGVAFMDSPGYDPVSATGQIAAGANLIAFTTGRGSCFGSRPAPCLKLSSNTPMYQQIQDDMDINCGSLIDGDMTLEELGQSIFESLIAIASGQTTKSEQFGYGFDEFIPWQFGATL